MSLQDESLVDFPSTGISNMMRPLYTYSSLSHCSDSHCNLHAGVEMMALEYLHYFVFFYRNHTGHQSCCSNFTGGNMSLQESLVDFPSTGDQQLNETTIPIQASVVTLIVIYMLGFGIGVGTVPWLLLGELCPSEVKGKIYGIKNSTRGAIFEKEITQR